MGLNSTLFHHHRLMVDCVLCVLISFGPEMRDITKFREQCNDQDDDGDGRNLTIRKYVALITLLVTTYAVI